jgi:hypothetical protein
VRTFAVATAASSTWTHDQTPPSDDRGLLPAAWSALAPPGGIGSLSSGRSASRQLATLLPLTTLRTEPSSRLMR